ncbi:hypothetical protein SELMODRAFT_406660 [Selaginella moellendorffii]|uniref:protein-tyrosine-phosphatase n=1 Tax=Selaginella moellendorffii TaxID=88036 RepID=D8R123_SELML|nr:dual specificity protein phosphatase 3 [Selaginella moellendorffii]EFJ34187.1 hypothetical protein SELMODRAFT_406660 [Selaginella moellendorffii]|eukprot:XP_002965349.1 dual specificity protein phosphatase 3 [Selaginella moellendorffii]
MKKVRDDLYLGDIGDALLFLSGTKAGVTHVLSVLPLCPNHESKDFVPYGPLSDANAFFRVSVELQNKCDFSGLPIRKVVPLEDSADENLLERLEECLEFIDRGVKEGIVLVHCGGGFSRSPSIMIAYLMWKEKLSFADALASLKKSSPSVDPNPGFVTQLKAFETNGFKVPKKTINKKENGKGTAKGKWVTCKICKKVVSIQEFQR